MLKFFIPEIIPSLNKGEAAIFKGIVKTLDCVGDNEIYLLSVHPEIDGPRYDIDNVKIITGDTLITPALYNNNKIYLGLSHIRATIKHVFFFLLYKILRSKALNIMKGSLWKTYAKSDVIIVGHDGSFSYFHLTLILFCKAIGKPIVVYGASMLPWIKSNPIIRSLVKFCLKKADLVTLREELSKQQLVEIGALNDHTYVTADKAFLLEPASEKIIDDVMTREGIKKDKDRLLVGFTVAYGTRVFKEAFSEINDPEEKRDRHSTVIASLIDHLVEKHNAHVVLIDHTIGFGDKYDDRIAAGDVYDKVNNKESTTFMNNEYTPEELKGLIGRCDLLVGERTHSVIAATSMGVPSLMITYPTDYRTHGIIGQMLGQEKWIYNCRTMRTETLIDHANKLLENKEAVRRDLLSLMPEVKERSMRNGVLMRELVERKNIIDA